MLSMLRTPKNQVNVKPSLLLLPFNGRKRITPMTGANTADLTIVLVFIPDYRPNILY